MITDSMKQLFKKTLFTLSILLTTFHAVKAQDTGKITKIGPQVFAAAIQGSTFVYDQQNQELVYTVVRGLPAHFVGYRTSTQEKVIDVPLNGTDGSWDLVVSTTGIVYIAGANGVLFSHQPGTDIVQNLGKPIETEKVLWDLTAAENGTIYGGTYPGCRVFSYSPSAGFNDLTGAAIVPSENYVRSVEYYKKNNKLFIGVGSHAHLTAFDLGKKQSRELLSDEQKKEEFVYDMKVMPGLKGGDRLFAFLTGANPETRTTLVYNIKSGKLEDELPLLDVKSLIKAQKGHRVYYISKGKLCVTDFSQKTRERQELQPISGRAMATSWDKNGHLSILTNQRKLYKYNPVANTINEVTLDIPRQPIEIQSIHFGPDKRVWVAGYLAGGHAAYDPATETTTAYNGLHQTEGMNTLGDDLYFGIYTQAELYRFNTQKKWDPKGANPNPRHLGSVPGQDRPFAVLPLKDHQKVLFGTIPAYGQLGGSITHYDVKSDKLDFYHQVVPNQAISALANIDGKVFGSTTIFGGLGAIPTEKEAVLFEWDVHQGRITYQTVPVPGAMAITGLMQGPDGNLWGFADGLLFCYDIQKKQVVRSKRFYTQTTRPSHIWRHAFMLTHPNGKVYLNAQRKLYEINPTDLNHKEIGENYDLLTMDDKGNLYFKGSLNLFKYTP